MSEKCFCHLGEFKVKDADARVQLAALDVEVKELKELAADLDARECPTAEELDAVEERVAALEQNGTGGSGASVDLTEVNERLTAIEDTVTEHLQQEDISVNTLTAQGAISAQVVETQGVVLEAYNNETEVYVGSIKTVKEIDGETVTVEIGKSADGITINGEKVLVEGDVDVTGKLDANGWSTEGGELASPLSNNKQAIYHPGGISYYNETNGTETSLSFPEGKTGTIATVEDIASAGSGGYVTAGQKEGSTLGENATAEGRNNIASGINSHAEGLYTTASGINSHAEGFYTTASGGKAHAQGENTVASGNNSHAEGLYTTAYGDFSHVQGKYNVADSNNKYAHIVGNGTYSARSNAHTLDWEGNAWYAGYVEAESFILTSPGGKRFALMVDDSGAISATEVTEE